MWQTIVNRYGGNGSVYFEPMNEPYGYSDTDWKNLAAQWLGRYPGVPKGRVVISGAGLTTEAQWESALTTSVGSYASRVIVDEWGAPMTDGRNYDASSTSDKFVSYLRGTAIASGRDRLRYSWGL